MSSYLETPAELWVPTFVDGQMAQTLRESGPLKDMLKWAISMPSAERKMSAIRLEDGLLAYGDIKVLCETHRIEPFNYHPPYAGGLSRNLRLKEAVRNLFGRVLQRARER